MSSSVMIVLSLESSSSRRISCGLGKRATKRERRLRAGGGDGSGREWKEMGGRRGNDDQHRSTFAQDLERTRQRTLSAIVTLVGLCQTFCTVP
mgnify:FL=1